MENMMPVADKHNKQKRIDDDTTRRTWSPSIWRKVDPNVFRAYIRERGYTFVRIERECKSLSERSIRTAMRSGKISINIAAKLCAFFEADCVTLFGDDETGGFSSVAKYLN